MDPVWKPFCCGECGKKFTAMEILKRHLKEEHSDKSVDERKKLVDELMKTNENLENQNIALEMEVKASHTIIARMKEENDKLKKGKNVAEKVIKNLQEKLNLQSKDISGVKKISEENEQLILDKETLEREVVEIQKENILKEENLKTIMNEMKFLEEKHSKNKEKKVEEKNSQTDALNLHYQESEKVPAINCSCCQNNFLSISDLEKHQKEMHRSTVKKHLESKLKKINYSLISEKFQLSVKLAKLKEREIEEKKCHCRKFCRIYHIKHNWKKSISDELSRRMKDF